MLAPIHPHTAAFYAVFAQERANAARGIPTTMLPNRSPSLIPLSGPAATPDPLSSPPRGEGHPSDDLTTRTLLLILTHRQLHASHAERQQRGRDC
jgi:hypothetical protein